MSTRTAVERLAREASFFASVTQAEAASEAPNVEVLLDRYLEMRRNTADAMRVIAESWIAPSQRRLREVVKELEAELIRRFGDRLPPNEIRVSGYGGVKPILYEYLVIRLGQPVSGSRLRALTGDQVHTERRLRELRDLGVRVDAEHVAGENQYTLEAEDLDFEYAVPYQMKRIIGGLSGLSAARRAALMAELGIDDL